MSRSGWSAVALASALVLIQSPVRAQQAEKENPTFAEIRNLPWQKGPMQGKIGSEGTLQVPAEAGLLSESDSERFFKLTGNLPEPGNTVMAYHDWWATFSFSDVGYVKDDEKLDPAALLSSLREIDEPSNKERRKLGYQELHTDGWAVMPHYDPETHHLEWGLRLKVDGDPDPVVNYTVRLLGRKGYESVTLVTSPQTLDKDVAELKAVLKNFDFNSGGKYAEFKPGDHVAEIGLGALIAGGAAAAIVKTGLWKTILVFLAASWKLVAAGAVALFAGIGRLFRKKA